MVKIIKGAQFRHIGSTIFVVIPKDMLRDSAWPFTPIRNYAPFLDETGKLLSKVPKRELQNPARLMITLEDGKLIIERDSSNEQQKQVN